MHPKIQKALAHLQEANYASYFEEMDDVVPISLQTIHQEHKGLFISGQKPFYFDQMLKTFAKEVNNNLQNLYPNYQNSEIKNIVGGEGQLEKEHLEETKKKFKYQCEKCENKIMQPGMSDSGGYILIVLVILTSVFGYSIFTSFWAILGGIIVSFFIIALSMTYFDFMNLPTICSRCSHRNYHGVEISKKNNNK
jgi:uncharacterized pyridoxamine 5'-phosphate oxidase family protein